MANELSRLLQDVAEMQRRQAGGVHQGTVEEVKGDKIRVAWGKDPDGKPVLSPWLDTSNHRGGARERRFYKKGQNVTIDTVNGEMDEAATVSADAPNEKFKAPDHAEEAGRRRRPINSANCTPRRRATPMKCSCARSARKMERAV